MLLLGIFQMEEWKHHNPFEEVFPQQNHQSLSVTLSNVFLDEQ